MREWLEWSSQGIQVLAVVLIVGSIIYGSLRFLAQLSGRVADPYRAYKVLLGRSLLLGLEFMVAADVIRTVLLDLTAKGLEILGALVVIRTFLSWTLVVELEGHWPWRLAALAAQTGQAEGDDAPRRVHQTVGRSDKPDHGPIEESVPSAAFNGDVPCTSQQP